MTKKVSKKAAKTTETVDSTETINNLLDRVAKIEKRQAVIIKGLKWAGEAISGLFGMQAAGAALKEVADKANAV